MTITAPRANNREEAIEQNFAAFEKILPTILISHTNEIALLRDGSIVDYFNKSSDALRAGNTKFSDKLFSIQKVISSEKAVELGWYTHSN